MMFNKQIMNDNDVNGVKPTVSNISLVQKRHVQVVPTDCQPSTFRIKQQIIHWAWNFRTPKNMTIHKMQS